MGLNLEVVVERAEDDEEVVSGSANDVVVVIVVVVVAAPNPFLFGNVSSTLQQAVEFGCAPNPMYRKESVISNLLRAIALIRRMVEPAVRTGNEISRSGLRGSGCLRRPVRQEITRPSVL